MIIRQPVVRRTTAGRLSRIALFREEPVAIIQSTMNRRSFLTNCAAVGGSVAVAKVDAVGQPDSPAGPEPRRYLIAELVTDFGGLNRHRRIVLEEKSIQHLRRLVGGEPYGRWLNLSVHAGVETYVRLSRTRIGAEAVDGDPFPLEVYLVASLKMRRP